MRVVVALALSLFAINPAAARDVKCDRWTDAHGRNLMKCEYVEAPQAPAAPPVQARPRTISAASLQPSPTTFAAVSAAATAAEAGDHPLRSLRHHCALRHARYAAHLCGSLRNGFLLLLPSCPLFSLSKKEFAILFVHSHWRTARGTRRNVTWITSPASRKVLSVLWTEFPPEPRLSFRL